MEVSQADCINDCQSDAFADVTALIMCAGSGSRTGLKYNKVLHCLGGKTVLENVLDRFTAAGVGRKLVVCSVRDIDEIKAIAGCYENTETVFGGATRTESVRMGLKAVGTCGIVCIHDGARPFVTAEAIRASIESARKFGSGICAVPVTDTVKTVTDGIITGTPERSGLYGAQTPQSFRFDEICRAYGAVEGDFTDDAAVYERAGYVARISQGDYSNIKITSPQDLLRLGGNIKIGTGFDVHRLTEGRRLILGGVNIPYSLGLDGHSDADVAVHAIMDALLSAVGLPDIGVMFPDTDKQYDGADSIGLLRRVAAAVCESKHKIGNISAVIMAQRPRLSAFIPSMRSNIAAALGISEDAVNISATTTECLGIIGEGKGIASNAVCLVLKE